MVLDRRNLREDHHKAVMTAQRSKISWWKLAFDKGPHSLHGIYTTALPCKKRLCGTSLVGADTRALVLPTDFERSYFVTPKCYAMGFERWTTVLGPLIQRKTRPRPCHSFFLFILHRFCTGSVPIRPPTFSPRITNSTVTLQTWSDAVPEAMTLKSHTNEHTVGRCDALHQTDYKLTTT